MTVCSAIFGRQQKTLKIPSQTHTMLYILRPNYYSHSSRNSLGKDASRELQIIFLSCIHNRLKTLNSCRKIQDEHLGVDKMGKKRSTDRGKRVRRSERTPNTPFASPRGDFTSDLSVSLVTQTLIPHYGM